jgi:hypothetical protein
MGLVEMLEAAAPDDPSVASSFDLWLHQAICPFSDISKDISETFNEV